MEGAAGGGSPLGLCQAVDSFPQGGCPNPSCAAAVQVAIIRVQSERWLARAGAISPEAAISYVPCCGAEPGLRAIPEGGLTPRG